MKKIIRTLLAVVLALTFIMPTALMSSCKKNEDDGLNILCTVFPIYDWVRNVVGDTEGISVSLLVNNGTDLHSYQPSFADTAAIKDSDAVVYVGGPSDTWVEDAIHNDTVSIKLSDVEGINLYNVSAHSIAEDHGHEHGHSDIFDEHLWLSIKNAIVSTEAICNTLSQLDEKNADAYRDNTDTYQHKLTSLDEQMERVADSINEAVIFADRFPFVYLFEDYGIDYYAAFEGCTTETNANFDTVIALSERLKASQCGHLFTTESPNTALVDSIIREASVNSRTVTLNSMQSIGGADVENSSYVDIMERNVTVINQIFSKSEG